MQLIWGITEICVQDHDKEHYIQVLTSAFSCTFTGLV